MGIFDKVFNKKNDNNSDTVKTITESWSVLTGQNNGKPMLIRKNTGCDNFIGNKNYSTSCGIAFKFLHPDTNELPDVAKEPELNNLEDDLFNIFQTDLNSIVAIVITTSGFREYVLYTTDKKEFEVRLLKLQEKYKQYELTSYDKPDKDWTTYKSFK